MASKKTKTRLIVFVLVVVSLVFGGFQEGLKIHINSNIELAQKISNYDGLTCDERKSKVESVRSNIKYSYYSSHNKVDVLYGFKIHELVRLKWVLVPFFLLANFVINAFLCKKLNLSVKKLMFVYTFVLVSLVIVFGGGKMLEIEFFPFIRRGVLFLETIIPVVVLYFSHIISDKNEY